MEPTLEPIDLTLYGLSFDAIFGQVLTFWESFSGVITLVVGFGITIWVIDVAISIFTGSFGFGASSIGSPGRGGNGLTGPSGSSGSSGRSGSSGAPAGEDYGRVTGVSEDDSGTTTEYSKGFTRTSIWRRKH